MRTLRSDKEYTKFYQDVVQGSQNLTDEPALPRKRKIPRRINDGADPHQYGTPEDFHRQHYFQASDEVTNQLSRRFDQKGIKIVAEVEKTLVFAACLNEEIVVSEVIRDTYRNDIQVEPLKAQL